jgi:hypothetical protein
MKKLLILITPVIIIAQSFMISNIPLPKTYIQNLDPYECDESCMREYLDKDMIFSFLAHANKKLIDKDLDEARAINISILNIGSYNAGAKLKIALLLPYKKIGKYASSTTNATFAYLMTKSHAFMLKSYKVESEDLQELQNALIDIEEDGFEYVIAPLTKKGVENIISINPDLNVYFPTINKKDVNSSSIFLYFGGIDYISQSNLLLKESVSTLVIFSDKSQTGNKLALYQEGAFLNMTYEDENDSLKNENEFSAFANVFEEDSPIQNDDLNSTQVEKKVIKYFLSRRTTNLEKYLKDNENIINGSFFINTPVVKSGMVMSQLTLYDTNATNILSTQINYDPLLLSMTQYIDRKNMIVANSITEQNNVLIETNSLLGNDIVYDWINYTTTVGVDYFYKLITGEEKEYNIDIVDNQMIYKIELLKPSKSKFIKYVPLTKEAE